jgi:MFS transporter, ACS family, pantothenate transporter
MTAPPTDLPHSTEPSVLYTENQLQIARQRMENIGRKAPSPFTRAKVVGFFNTWHIYLFLLSA